MALTTGKTPLPSNLHHVQAEAREGIATEHRAEDAMLQDQARLAAGAAGMNAASEAKGAAMNNALNRRISQAASDVQANLKSRKGC